MNKFYNLCPESLYTPELINIKSRLNVLKDNIQEHNREVFKELPNDNIPSLDVFKKHFKNLKVMPAKDFIIENLLNKSLIMRYIDESTIKPFRNYDEALTAILQETSNIYRWFRDADNERIYLESNHVDTEMNPYASSTYIFSEFQSFLFSIAQGLYKLNNSKLPHNFGLTDLDVRQNTLLLSGLYNITSFSALLHYIYIYFEDIYELTTENSHWMEYNHPNSSIETFISHKNVLIRLLKFLEPRVDNTAWTNEKESDIISLLNQRFNIPDDLSRETF